ncbi:MAG: response regulator transcription factor [Flavobacteriales bacterium]|jgi:DNA-binding NarL/FixJ family response regulator|nr:response regulator transcription factor [Flavobacteriales bacterium]MBK6551814.1 response regulator transcription factor [Flavobacteriales bacterium]MBK6882341.1 response regulator transcription factor [Flavobacteriales bacterium]MBK7101441.1 response regulator transcription factor [Flavobacteriales bacterium]MBK7112150.1 response regulator transcription factor [Flavobacteriales bacterium]
MIVRTLLADHSELALIGLQAVLADSARIEVVGVARDVIAMEALIVRHRPHVVLIDHTSEGFGPQAVQQGIRRSKRARFVAITPDPSTSTLISAIRAGVTSYIRKDCDVQEIRDAITATADGSKFFCGKVLDVLRKAAFDVDRFICEPLSCDPVVLSDRECQVITLIAEGRSYTQIADELILSSHTVIAHRRNIMQKLGVNNTASVVLYAVKNGFVSPNKYLFDRTA